MLSIIIPCFNEQEVIEKTYQRLKKVLTDINVKHELIFINDGSRDNTLNILISLAHSDNAVKVINFSRNFGHQPAVTAGIANCTGDNAVIIDGDLQDPPEVIPQMLDIVAKEKCNVVYGVRVNRKGETWFKKFTAKSYYKTINYLSDTNLPQDTGDFRLIDRKVINEFKKLGEKNKYIRGLISWVGFKQCPVYYEREARFAGETKYPLSKMLKFAGNGLIYFTKKPLSIAITLGFLCFLIGLVMAIFTLYIKIEQPSSTVPGWASTIIVIIFFGGVQLLSIGILGKYLACVFDEVKNRPEYIIDSKHNF